MDNSNDKNQQRYIFSILSKIKASGGDGTTPAFSQARIEFVESLPTASANTLGVIYVIPNQDGESGSIHFTKYDGQSYSWVAAGEKGEAGATPNITIGTVTSGEQASATIGGTPANPILNLVLPQGPQGPQGNTGSSVDYPFELVNNLTTNDPTQALSAAMGIQLESEVSQLEAKVDGNSTTNYTTGGYVNNGGSITASDIYAYSDYIPVSGGVAYSLDYGQIDQNLYVVVYNSNKSKLDFWTLYPNATTKNITTSANAAYLRFSFKPTSVAKVYEGSTVIWEKMEASEGLVAQVADLENRAETLEEQVADLELQVAGAKRFTEGGYINAGGVVTSQQGLCYTDFIPVTAGDSYTFDFGTIPQQLYIVFYDSNKAKVDYYSESPSTTSRTVTAYANSAYVRFSFVPTYDAKIYHGDTLIYNALDKGILDKVNEVETEMDGILADWEEKINVTDGKYNNALNALVTDANYRYTDYIDVTAGEKVTVDFGDAPIQLYLCFVNDSLQNVDYFSLSPGFKRRTVTVPTGATKMRFSCLTTHNPLVLQDSVVVWEGIVPTIPDRIENLEKGEEILSERVDAIEVETIQTDVDYKGNEIQVFCKGVALGDSLTKGSMNYTTPSPASTVVMPKFSYPSKLTQMTGIEMGNISMGGISTAEFYELYKNDDWSGYEFAIIQLGVNDHAPGQSSWPVADKTGMENIITKLQNENTGIFVFVSTIIPATAYAGRDYISQGIRDLVEELDDDHIILLDMAENSHIGESAGYNNGHLSALGYTKLATEYRNYISYVISQNKELFRKIQFIGTQYDYQP